MFETPKNLHHSHKVEIIIKIKDYAIRQISQHNLIIMNSHIIESEHIFTCEWSNCGHITSYVSSTQNKTSNYKRNSKSKDTLFVYIYVFYTVYPE